jgi:Type II secretion system (T2SS), protein E, N-terminal domain
LPKPLAEIVLEEGLANAASLERAAAAADRDGTPLVCALVRECEIDEVALLAALRRHVRVATEDPATVAPEPEAVREVQRDVCRRQRVAPLSLSSYGGEGRVLRLAMADPTDAVAVAEVEHVTGCRVEPVLMTVSAVEELVEKTYRALVTEVMRRVDDGAAPEPPAPHTARGKSGASSPNAEGDAADARPALPPVDTVTVPFHRLSEEAPVETRLRALINVLQARNLVSQEELEEAVRELMKRRAGEDGG